MQEQVISAQEAAAEGETFAESEVLAVLEAPQKRRINRAVLSENLWGWFFISFLVLGTTIFVYFSFVLSVWLSFLDYRGAGGTFWDALGRGSDDALYWYRYMFNTTITNSAGFEVDGGWKYFGSSLLNTVFYLVGIPVGMAVSLFFAALMSRDIKGAGTFRVIYYIPTVSSIVSITILWQNLFGVGGVMEDLFNTSFMGGDQWMQKLTVLILTTWKGLGGSILLLCAGMNGVNESHKEAASIDGANAWTTFWRISLPQLWPTIFYCIVTSFIGGMQIFTEPELIFGNVVTDGAVFEGVTAFVGIIYGYFGASEYHWYSYCAALGIILMIIILLLTLVQFWLNRKQEA